MEVAVGRAEAGVCGPQPPGAGNDAQRAGAAASHRLAGRGVPAVRHPADERTEARKTRSVWRGGMRGRRSRGDAPFDDRAGVDEREGAASCGDEA